MASCQGGAPRMTSGYFVSGQFAQDPTPQVSCDMAAALFKGKWGADEVQVARINGAVSEGLKACIAKVPDSGDCQHQVSDLAASCRVDLQQTANLLLGNLSLESEALGNAKGKRAENADQYAPREHPGNRLRLEPLACGIGGGEAIIHARVRPSQQSPVAFLPAFRL